MITKNKIDREFLSKTEQLGIETDPLMCKLCDKEIHEQERFDYVTIYGNTFYYHESCGKQLVFDRLDKKLTVDEKFEGTNA